MNNSVVHFEIPADDHARAKKFYAEAFGWAQTDMDGPTGKYTVVQTGPVDEKRMPTETGFIDGGIGPRMGALLHPTIMINVASLDEACQKVEGAGGKVISEKFLVPNMGNYVYIQDSEGNNIGLWETTPRAQ